MGFHERYYWNHNQNNHPKTPSLLPIHPATIPHHIIKPIPPQIKNISTRHLRPLTNHPPLQIQSLPIPTADQITTTQPTTKLQQNIYRNMGNLTQPAGQQPHDLPQGKGRYEGECDDLGRPDGQGKMYYSDGSIFVGKFEKALPAQGKFTYKNGDTYEGLLDKCRPHGEGTWTETNGTFKGQFSDGEFVNGTVNYSDKSVFVGYMKNGLKHGQNCEFTFAEGDKFKGEFAEDQFKQGTYESVDGVSYRGGFRQGLKHGRGKYVLRGVVEYEGEFIDDQFQGYGKLKNIKENTYYEGDFKGGKKHGKGKLTQANGAVYDGDFINNQKNGRGIFTFKSKVYEGEFKDNRFHGEGELNYGNGDIYIGHFKEGKKDGQGKLSMGRARQEYRGEFKNDKIEGFGFLVYSNGDIYEGNYRDSKKDGRGKYSCSARDQTYEGFWTMDVKNGKFTQEKRKEGVRIEGEFVNGQRHGTFIVTTISTGEEQRREQWAKGKLEYQ